MSAQMCRTNSQWWWTFTYSAGTSPNYNQWDVDNNTAASYDMYVKYQTISVYIPYEAWRSFDVRGDDGFAYAKAIAEQPVGRR